MCCGVGGAGGMYEFLVTLIQPFTLLYLLLGAATVNLWRKPREKRGRLLFLTLSFVGLTLVCTPAVAHVALGSLEWQFAPADEMPDGAQAIVVLSAGVRPPSGARIKAELDEDSLQRCLHAADLYRLRPTCTVVVSGGKVDPEVPGPACATMMRDFLVRVGVRDSDIKVEDSSRTTYENAVECAKLLKHAGLEKAVLVTDAVDMFRALRCFRKQGLELTPSPCRYRATEFKATIFAFLPSPGAAKGCQRAWHEWLGTVWYWLKGRI
jgi:uncharacterized SAM-binding protein YcdF (DUF218 family)